MNFHDLSTRIMDRIRPIREAESTAVTLPKVQQKMVDKYGAQPLVKSTLKGENWYKFWLMSDGTVIPVEFTHDGTSRKANVGYDSLLLSGAIRGSIRGEATLVFECKRDPSYKQIESLKKLFVRYGIMEVVYSYSRKGYAYSGEVKSPDHLEYLIKYGTIDEAKIKEDGTGPAPAAPAGPVTGPNVGGSTTEDDISYIPAHLGARRKRKKRLIKARIKEAKHDWDFYREKNTVVGFIWYDGTFDAFDPRIEHADALEKFTKYSDDIKFVDFIIEKGAPVIMGIRIDHLLSNSEVRTINRLIKDFDVIRLNIDMYFVGDPDVGSESFDPVDSSWWTKISEILTKYKPVKESLKDYEDQFLNDKFREGFDAYYEEKLTGSYVKCPYKSDTRDFADWVFGYSTAKKEEKKLLRKPKRELKHGSPFEHLIREAAEDDLSRLRKELKNELVKLFDRDEFVITTKAWNSFKSAFGQGRSRTARVAVSCENKQKDAQRLYGRLLRQYGEDKGNLEIMIAAMQEGRPLGQFATMSDFDNLFGTRTEVVFQGVKIVLEATVDFIYDPTQTLYIDDPELLDRIEEDLGDVVKRRKNVLYPIGGKFRLDFFDSLKSMMSDSVEEPEDEEQIEKNS